ESVDDVKTKERIWLDSVRPALRPFRSVANLWTACFFENGLPQQDYEALLELLDVDPKKVRPWKTGEEFQEIVLNAVEKGTLELAGREFDKNQLKNLCAFLVRAENIARRRRFFHWELEFPEVFFSNDGSHKEDPGFDAVIGNPPYGMPRDAELKEFAAILYRSAEGRDDLYKLFTERAAMLTHARGFFSYIVSNTILSNRFDAKLRRLLLS